MTAGLTECTNNRMAKDSSQSQERPSLSKVILLPALQSSPKWQRRQNLCTVPGSFHKEHSRSLQHTADSGAATNARPGRAFWLLVSETGGIHGPFIAAWGRKAKGFPSLFQPRVQQEKEGESVWRSWVSLANPPFKRYREEQPLHFHPSLFNSIFPTPVFQQVVGWNVT